MGLPIFEINFIKKSENFIARSAQGVICLILVDETEGVEKGVIKEYKTLKETENETYSVRNKEIIKLAFKEKINKLMVVCVDSMTDTTDGKINIDKALELLLLKKFNYLVVPSATQTEQEKLIEWVRKHREFYMPTRLVLYNYSKSGFNGERFVYNFVTNDVIVDTISFTGGEYAVRIASVLASTPINQSITGHDLYEVKKASSISNEDLAVDEGKIFLVTDGDYYSISRGVTSVTEVTPDEIEDFKKIRISETADMIYNDIQVAWNKQYKGKVMNTYNNKLLFFAAVRTYLQNLENLGVLDVSGGNKLTIDIDKNREFLEAKGKDVDSMTEQEIKEANTGSNVYATGNILIADAMEDFTLNLYL